MEIRHGRMTREEGIEMVNMYDSNEPESLEVYLDFLEITKKQFFDWVEPMRDPAIWEKINGTWRVKDSVANHVRGDKIEKARVPQSDDRTFSINNRHLNYCDQHPPLKTGDPRLDEKSKYFKIM
jgi:hypothetical protein